jgi:hypothetical protein
MTPPPSMIALATVMALLPGLAPSAAETSLTELLEKGDYAEETQGDLPAAIEIYKKISAQLDGERPTVAHALFRLGMCYLKSGRETEATAAFHRLDAQYPEQRELLAKVPPKSARQLDPAPWGREEVLVMIGPPQRGFEILRVAEVVEAGRPVTRCERYFQYGFSAVLADPRTMQPIASEYEHVAHWWRTDLGHHASLSYAPGHVEVRESSGDNTRTTRFDTAGIVYDATSLAQVIRRLPLADGFRTEISHVHPERGIQKAIVEVRGRERIDVPAGAFDAYRVTVAEGDLEDEIYWYSTDAARLLLRKGYLQLSEIRSTAHAGTTTIRDARLSVRVTLPRDWLLAAADPKDKTHFNACAMPPGMVAICQMRHLPATERKGARTADEMAELLITERRRKSNCTLRPGDPERFELNGRPAARWLVDDRGVKAYWVVVTHGEERIWLWFDVKTERWDTMKPVLDEIVASFRVE